MLLGGSRPKIAAMLTEEDRDVLVFARFPRRHWRQNRSTNPLERFNLEIERGTDVVSVLRNAACCAWLG